MAWAAANCQRRKIACVMRALHNDAMTSDIMTSDIADEPPGDPTYAFKASLIGSMCQFTLKPDALEWQIGRRSGRIRYDAIRAVRLLTSRIADAILEGRGSLDKEEAAVEAAAGAEAVPLEGEVAAAAESGA